MNYEELFNNSLTNVPKTFPELFCNTEILLEMYNRKVVNVNVEDGIYANVYQFESIQEFLNERNLKLNDLNNFTNVTVIKY